MRPTILIAVSFCCASVAAYSAEFLGSVDRIADGDTFWVCDTTACHKIRLCGADAPEKGEPGYQTSAEALRRLVADKIVRCIQVGNGTPCDGRSKPTNYDRIVAQCFVDGADIAASMVEHGFACDWVKFSGGAYSHRGKGRPCRQGTAPMDHPEREHGRSSKLDFSSDRQSYLPFPVALGCCCKCCSTGKACGNSCISRSYKCHKGSGCACDQPYCEPQC